MRSYKALQNLASTDKGVAFFVSTGKRYITSLAYLSGHTFSNIPREVLFKEVATMRF